jgi:hypothetical protein
LAKPCRVDPNGLEVEPCRSRLEEWVGWDLFGWLFLVAEKFYLWWFLVAEKFHL